MAQNAIILSGALKRMVDAQALAHKWVTYNSNKSVTVDDSRNARDWVRGNVTFNSSALSSALNQTHASGYAFGEKDAQQELTSSVGFNWDTWNPGNEGAAMLVDPPNGLKELMAQNGVTIKGIEDTNIDRIGTALALGLDQGLTVDETARAIDYVVANPARSLVIARTETARALVQANLVTYREANVESVEWLVADPCEICAANDGVVVPLGEAFPSGDTEPPAHPNCVCDVAPVLSDVSGSFGEEPPVDGEPVDGEGDVTNVSPEGEDTVIHDGVIDEAPAETFTREQELAREEFIVGRWVEINDRNAILEQEQKQYFTKLREYKPNRRFTDEQLMDFIKKDAKTYEFANKAKVIKNGNVHIKVENADRIPQELLDRFIASVERLQIAQPKDEMNVYIGGGVKKNAYGQATLGNANIRIAEKTVLQGQQPDPKAAGAFKMPALGEHAQFDYTLAHEWGHSIDVSQSVNYASRSAQIKKVYTENKDKENAFVSGYSHENNKEMFAEMFAEWYLSKGKSTNPVVNSFAEKFGWHYAG